MTTSNSFFALDCQVPFQELGLHSGNDEAGVI